MCILEPRKEELMKAYVKDKLRALLFDLTEAQPAFAVA
jgi:hypothetical protein